MHYGPWIKYAESSIPVVLLMFSFYKRHFSKLQNEYMIDRINTKLHKIVRFAE